MATKNREEIIKTLLVNGATQVKGLTIKKVETKEYENYVQVSMTFDKPIKSVITTDDGETFEDADVHVAFMSLYAIRPQFELNPKTAFLGSHIIKQPDAVELLLPGCKINLIQQKVPANTPYINPWSSEENPEPREFDHDLYINHIESIEFGDNCMEVVNELRKYKLTGKF